MAQKVLDKFAKENFGRKYIPVLHGRSTSIEPTVLILKQKREWWKKPFHRSEMKVLSNLGRLVDPDHLKTYEDISESLLTRNQRKLEKKEISEEISEQDLSVDILYNSHFGCKATCKMGDVVLGSMDEEFYDDLALRDVLQSAVLDPDRISVYAPHHLYLVTGVIYSAKLRFAGKRQRRTEVSAHVSSKTRLGTWVSKLGDVKGEYSSLKCKAAMVERTKRAPFMFTVCRVIYDKETKRLKLPDNVFVGKDVVSRGRTSVKLNNSYDDKFDFNVVEPPDEQSGDDILHIQELELKMERLKQLLLSVHSEKERETLIVKYLMMLEGLFTGNRLFVDTSTNDNDSGHNFLTDLGLDDNDLVSEVGFEKIQDYGTILHYLHHISGCERDKWEEFMMILNEEQTTATQIPETSR